jgi:outer membrane protein W
MKKTVLLLAAMLLMVNITVMAQEEEEERDVLEVGFYGGMAFPSSDLSEWQTDLGADNGFSVGVNLGYFVTSSFIVGADLRYTQFGIKDADDISDQRHRFYTPSLYAKYYFSGDSDFEPYLKAHVGLENAKFSTFAVNSSGQRYRELSYGPALSLGAGGGLFYYTSDYSGLYLEADYRFSDTESSTADYESVDYEFGAKSAVISLYFGIRILFGSGD